MPIIKKKTVEPTHAERVASAQALATNALGVFAVVVEDLEEASAQQLDVAEALQEEIDNLVALQEEADLAAVDAQIAADRIKSLFN